MILSPERHLNRREASTFLKEHGFPVAPATLAKLACIGGGPLMHVFGRQPLYLPSELLDWARARTRTRRHTSEPVKSGGVAA